MCKMNFKKKLNIKNFAFTVAGISFYFVCRPLSSVKLLVYEILQKIYVDKGCAIKHLQLHCHVVMLPGCWVVP